ncbi:glycosyltransferase family A protein [Lachnospiraceae bacterium C1.1]|nr:glycosyltransferase family A protein [Lachnospiraceae bacterium C1.1]
MDRTPILLLTYNRPHEFAMTIESLSCCNHSNEYEIHVNIDAPNIFKSDDSSKQVQIRETIERYKKKFKNIYVKEHKYHKGLANSVIESVSALLKKHHQVIVIEDDFLLSSDCLDYLEEALAYYEDKPNIWSVTAFSSPFTSLKYYKKDTYLSYRPCSWVWGTWADRWSGIDWGILYYIQNGIDYKNQLNFTRGGYDLPEGMRRQVLGLTDSWAIRWGYAASKRDMKTVYPTLNRVAHIGFNGTHVRESFPQMELKEEYEKCVFSLDYSKRIISEQRNFYGFSYNQWRKDYSNGKYRNLDKYEGLFHVLLMWKKINLKGHNISEYFSNRDYHSIAIYGMGRIGLLLQAELENSAVEVSYFIDREKNSNAIKTYKPNDDLPFSDCVVVTIVEEAALIRDYLYKKGVKNLKTILEVLRDV